MKGFYIFFNLPHTEVIGLNINFDKKKKKEFPDKKFHSISCP